VEPGVRAMVRRKKKSSSSPGEIEMNQAIQQLALKESFQAQELVSQLTGW